MKKYVVLNWKMNGSFGLMEQVFPFLDCNFKTFNPIIWALPFTLLGGLTKKISTSHSTHIALCAQNVSEHSHGAFTGEISANHLKEIGCQYVLVGHSERRQFFNERLDVIAKKCEQAINLGITPILCVGESKNQNVYEILEEQLSIPSIEQCLIAYEPVWAIGTGHVATLEHIETIQKWITQKTKRPVLYGGSITVQNKEDILSITDGILVGGASLDINFIKNLK